jgi:hypothetical protein
MKLNDLMLITQENSQWKLNELIQPPPNSGKSDRGWNILHFNSLNRPHTNNPSADKFVRNVLRPGRARALKSDCAALQYAVALARELNDVDNDATGIYLELGFCTGRSLTFLAALGYDKEVYGVDSCKGLPKDWREGFPKGTFQFLKDANGADAPEGPFTTVQPFIPFVPLANTTLIVDTVERSLPIFCSEVLSKDDVMLELLHIDTDLYDSAHNAFTELMPHIVPSRTVIILDEGFNYFAEEDTSEHAAWRDHEYKALEELVRDMNARRKDRLMLRYHAYNENHQQLVVTLEPAPSTA